MIMSVSTFSMCNGAARPLTMVNFSTVDGEAVGGREGSAPSELGADGGAGAGDAVESSKKSKALTVFIAGAAAVFASAILPMNFLTSVNLPVRAAAAAMAGLRR